MAKRKSKTGKQKQAKAAGKKFGVSVKKGRDQPKITLLSSSASTNVVVKNKRDASLSVTPIDNKTNNNKTKNNNNNNRMGERLQQKAPPPFPHRTKKGWNRKKSRQQHPADNAFGKEMESAQERSRVQQKRDKEKKNRSGLLPTLKPATLIVDDYQKSTQRLVDEAAKQVSTGMQGIGTGLIEQQVQQDYPIASFPNISSSQYRLEAEPSSPLETNNPWAALHQVDSDDDEEQRMIPPAPKLFQFAPPSFAIHDGDFDPDL